jgi:hypothetical protein
LDFRLGSVLAVPAEWPESPNLAGKLCAMQQVGDMQEMHNGEVSFKPKLTHQILLLYFNVLKSTIGGN